MFVVSLITNQKTTPLNPAWPENLRNAWGGGTVDWLSPDEAAEFQVETRPGNFEDVWAETQAAGIDLCIQPAKSRKKSLLLADMDCTMIEQECIDELADAAGVGEQVRDVTKRAMNGDLNFEAAVRERLGLMKGLDARVVEEVLRSRISFAAGGPTLLATMRKNGAYTALVSGGFTAFSSEVARLLGFDEHNANELGIEDGHLTGTVVGPILGREAKVTKLNELAQRLGLTPEDVVAVGDGANDLGMLRAAGAGVAVHAKPAVAAQADLRINHGDLTALLFLQGYAKSEFVSVPTPAL